MSHFLDRPKIQLECCFFITNFTVNIFRTTILTSSCCNLCSEGVLGSDPWGSDRSSAWSRYRVRFVWARSSSSYDMQRPLSDFRFALLTVRCELAYVIRLWMEINKWNEKVFTKLETEFGARSTTTSVEKRCKRGESCRVGSFDDVGYAVRKCEFE